MANAHETTAPAQATRTYGSGWLTCTLGEPQKHWNLRSSGDFTVLRNMFAQVVVKRVVATVVQSNLTAPNPGSSDEVYTLDFGLAERERDQIEFGCMPDFHTINVGGTTPQSVRVVWGEGGEPFPTGLQLDLRLGEQRFKWPAFYIGHEHHIAGDAFELVRYKLLVTVECSMQASAAM